MRLSTDLAYLLGVFAGDGSMYYSGGSTRIEIIDGTHVEEEIKYSREFLKNIQEIIYRLFNKKTTIIRKGNKLVLRFRSKRFTETLVEFGFSPGKKGKTVNIPQQFIDNDNLEIAFWIGVMDTDGMIGRKTKKVTLTSISKSLCTSFSKFLQKKNIQHSFFEYKPKTGYSNASLAFVVQINSPFVSKFARIIGFEHPRKKKWLLKHIKKEFYVKRTANFKPFIIEDRIIDYEKIVSNRVFVIDGIKAAEDLELEIKEHSHTKNLPFYEIINASKQKGLSKKEVLKELSDFRFKMSKGSTTSVRLPFVFSNNLATIAEMVRLKEGGIRISRAYTKTCGKDLQKVINDICEIFDVKQSITSKGEITFNSGVLNELFSKVTK